MATAIRAADVVVAHAGTGIALMALENGKCPILVPRRSMHGEHVDDHQLTIALELALRDLCISRDADSLKERDLVAAASRTVTKVTDPPQLRITSVRAARGSAAAGHGAAADGRGCRDRGTTCTCARTEMWGYRPVGGPRARVHDIRIGTVARWRAVKGGVEHGQLDDLDGAGPRAWWATRATVLVLVAALNALVGPALLGGPSPANAADPCGAGGNKIACENSKPGTDPDIWDIQGAGDSSIQGFATDISVNVGQRIDFKIATTASSYTIDIYRTGWYQGLGAR